VPWSDGWAYKLIISIALRPKKANMPTSFPIQYRRLQWSDYAVCKDVFRKAFAYSEWCRLSEAWSSRTTDACYVSTYRGAIVGFSLIADNSVKYIAVHPEYQGYKVGSGLLTRSLRSVPDLRSIRLITAGDERLVGWYGRYGFCVSVELVGADGGFIGAHMVRRQRCRSAIRV
jgi:GNAT superfamily N-acetyltransferase